MNLVEVDNRKPLIITIIILIVIIIGLGGFIALDKLVINRKEETKVTTIKNVEIDLNAMHQINNTLNRMDNTFNDINSNFLGYIYNSKKIEAKNFDPLAALFVAMHDDMIPANTNLVLINGLVKKNFESIFGKELAYEPKNIDAGNYYKIIYDEATSNYTYILSPIDRNYQPGYVSYNIKTELADGKVIITRKVCYVEYANNSVSIYKEANKQQLVGTLRLRNGIIDQSELLGKYASKLNTYVYTFVQNTADNYTFYSIEREK